MAPSVSLRPINSINVGVSTRSIPMLAPRASALLHYLCAYVVDLRKEQGPLAMPSSYPPCRLPDEACQN